MEGEEQISSSRLRLVQFSEVRVCAVYELREHRW